MSNIPSITRELISVDESGVNGFADTFIFEPETAKEKRLGILFVVAEITKPSKHSKDLIEGIAEMMQNQFYKGEEADILKNFELSLRNVNETLAEIAEHGITSWIGNMNATIAVLKDSELHVATTGDSNAYLIRNEEIASIKAKYFPTQADKDNPLKTFVNVASGRVYEGDKLLFTTPSLIEYLSSEKILRTLEGSGLAGAIESLTTLLDEYKNEVNTASIITYIGEEEEEKAVPTATPVPETEERGKETETILPQKELEIKAEPEKEVALPERKEKSEAPLLSKEGLKSAGRNTGEYLKSLPGKARGLLSRNRDDSAPRQRVPRTEGGKNPAIKVLKTIGNGIKALVVFVYIKLFRPFASWFMRLSLKRKLYLIGAVALVIILVFSINAILGDKEEQAEVIDVSALLSEAQDLNNQGNAELVFGNKGEALTLFTDAEGKVNQVLEADPGNTEAETLLNDIREGIDRATNKTVVTPETLFEIGSIAENSSPNQLVKAGDGIYTINTSDNTIIEYLLATNNGQELPLNVEAKPVRLGTVGTDLIALTSLPSLIQRSSTSFSTIKSAFRSNDFVNLSAMESYGDNIYGLLPSVDMIYMFVETEDGYAGAEQWLDEKSTSLSDAVDMTIDGSIYVLKADGTIAKFLSGVEESFEVKGLPSEISKPTRIQAYEGGTFIYLFDADSKSIVALDKEGNFKAIYKWSDDGVKDAFIDEPGKTAYLLTDTEVKKFSL